jgi:hypothetical protein
MDDLEMVYYPVETLTSIEVWESCLYYYPMLAFYGFILGLIL